MAAAQFRSTLDGFIVQFASLWKDFDTAMQLQLVVVTNEIADVTHSMADNISKPLRVCFWYSA